jgi:ABC-type branched-subunit amino acid transport system substrate-binding protein
MVAASAFDGIMVMAHAIKTAGTDPDKIVNAISKIKDFKDAVTGPLVSFDDQGVVTRYIAVQVVKNQAFTRLAVCKDPALVTP